MKTLILIYLLLAIKGIALIYLGFTETGLLFIALSLLMSWYVTINIIGRRRDEKD